MSRKTSKDAESSIHWRNSLGLLAELRAAQWLVEQGFWTFIPVGGVGPIDLIAVSKTGKIHLFDVKHAARRSGSGYIINRSLTTFQKLIGVKLLYVDTDTNEVFISLDKETADRKGFIKSRETTLPNE